MALKDRIFLDANVLVSASVSSKGASRKILDLGLERKLNLVTTYYAIKESRRNIEKKLPEALPRYERYLKEGRFKIQKNTSKKETVIYEELIDDLGDVPIIAACVKYKVKFLITLDRKHLIGNQQLSVKTGLCILLPGEFMKLFRQSKI